MNRYLVNAIALFLMLPTASAQQLGGVESDAKLKPGASSGASANVFSHNGYTGNADVVIPISTFSNDFGNFGVGISYNTKGVKVDEMASEVGLHWALNGIPTISRVVKDLPDELNIEADTLLEHEYYDHSIIHVNYFWRIKGKYATYTESSASASDPQVFRDSETDDFTINLPNGSYTFNLGKSGHHFVHPAKNLKIETVFSGVVMTDINGIDAGMSHHMDFNITFPDGVKIFFIRSEYSDHPVYDILGLNYQISAYSLTTTWVAEKVIFPDGSEIRYTYDPKNITSQIWGYSYTRREMLPGTQDPIVSPVPGRAIPFQRIKRIDYPNGTNAEFIYDESRPRVDLPEGRALAEIKITGGDNCLSYKFDYAYFYSEPVPSTTDRYELGYTEGLPYSTIDKERKSRLKLKGIKTASCDGLVEEPFYTFEYNEVVRLPMRGSASQDLFGYANGEATPPTGLSYPFNTMIPRHTIPVSGSSPYYTYGEVRPQNTNYISANILKKIKNAYGGEIEFYYGSHNVSPVILPLLPTDELYFGKNIHDGIRVDSIIERDYWHPTNIRTSVFQYANGQIFLNGGYFHYPTFVDSATLAVGDRNFGSNFVTQHQFVSGANQGYGSVTTIVRDQNGEQLSKQVVVYTNFSDATSGGISRYFFTGGGKHFHQLPFTNKKYIKDWEMGLPLTITDYDQYNRIVTKTTNSYTFTLDTTSTIGYVENTKMLYLPNQSSTKTRHLSIIADYYRPYTGAALLSSSVIQKYMSDTRSINDTILFTYDARNNSKSILTRTSEGAQIRTEQIYNYNLNGAPGSVVYSMNQAGIEKQIGTLRWKVGSGGFTSDELLDGYFTTYTYASNRLSPNATYALHIEAPLSYSAYTGYTGGPALPNPHDILLPAFSGISINHFKQSSKVMVRDPRGNSLESQLNGQNQYIAMVWDTISGRKLAEASNCQYEDIAYCSFENTDPGPYSTTLVTRGNLIFYANQIESGGTVKAVTGSKIYKLTTTSNQNITSSQNLQVGREYTLSFWAKGATPRVFYNDVAVSLTGANVYTISGSNWKHYMVNITPTTSGKVKIAGPATPTTMYFDEIRLYPSNAMMTSWTYETLFGVSSETDARGRVIYYEYDKMGRNHIIRDQEGNIISKKQFVLSGAE